MAVKTHRTIHTVQQWNQWLSHSLGDHLIRAEKKFLNSVWIDRSINKQVVLIGVPHQAHLLPSRMTSIPILVSSLHSQQHFIHSIETRLHELPILSGSVDCVVLPHTLEFVDNPQQLLAEACRIVKPEGDIIILGFNPYSLWGLKKYFMPQSPQSIPWTGTFYKTGKILNWLKLADFQLIKQQRFLFRPPVKCERIYQKLSWLEWVGSQCYAPFGAVYILIAKAKVIPLTPIKLQWRQKLPVLSPHFSGSTLRDSAS